MCVCTTLFIERCSCLRMFICVPFGLCLCVCLYVRGLLCEGSMYVSVFVCVCMCAVVVMSWTLHHTGPETSYCGYSGHF